MVLGLQASRFAGIVEDETPEEIQAAIALADLGVKRQDQISTAAANKRNKSHYIHVHTSQLPASRDSSIEGTEAAQNAKLYKDQLQAWESLEPIDDGGEVEKNDIAGGQSHRRRVRAALEADGSVEPTRLPNAGNDVQSPSYGGSAPSLVQLQGSHIPTFPSPSQLIKPSNDALPPLTPDQWQAMKQSYDTAGIASINLLHPEVREATTDPLNRGPVKRRFHSDSTSAPSKRHNGAASAPGSAAPAGRRARLVCNMPVAGAWSSGNLVENPDPPTAATAKTSHCHYAAGIPTSNPSALTSEYAIRRYLGDSFIETTKNEVKPLQPSASSLVAQEQQTAFLNPPDIRDAKSTDPVALMSKEIITQYMGLTAFTEPQAITPAPAPAPAPAAHVAQPVQTTDVESVESSEQPRSPFSTCFNPDPKFTTLALFQGQRLDPFSPPVVRNPLVILPVLSMADISLIASSATSSSSTTDMDDLSELMKKLSVIPASTLADIPPNEEVDLIIFTSPAKKLTGKPGNPLVDLTDHNSDHTQPEDITDAANAPTYTMPLQNDMHPNPSKTSSVFAQQDIFAPQIADRGLRSEDLQACRNQILSSGEEFWNSRGAMNGFASHVPVTNDTA